MIENMRKYTGLMVVVIILLAAGLILTMNETGSGPGGGSEFMQVNGVDVDRNDFNKEGKNSLAALLNAGGKMPSFVALLSGAEPINVYTGQFSTRDQLNFVTNRILLKQEAEKLGVYPSVRAAKNYIADQLFVGRDGTFDQTLYTTYIENISNLGLKESDFQNLVAEFLVFEKTLELVGGGLEPSTQETIAINQLNQQSIGLDVVTFKLDAFKKDINPGEDAVKAFWETHKDRYKTKTLRKVSYVLALMDDSDAPVRPAPVIGASPEEVSQQNVAYQTVKEAWDLKRKSSSKPLRKAFSDFVDAVDDAEGVNFDAVAAETAKTAGSDFVVSTTEFFAVDEAPEPLKGLLLKHAPPGTTVAQSLFNEAFSSKLMFNIHTYSVGMDGNIAVRIDAEKLPETKTYEEAKALAKEDLINDLALKAMQKAAEEAKAKLEEALANTSFVDAAKEFNLTVKTLKPFDQKTLPVNEAYADEYFRIAQVTNPHTIASEILSGPSESAIIYVRSRTIKENDNASIAEAQLLSSQSNYMKYAVFNAWLLQNREANSEHIKLPKFQ